MKEECLELIQLTKLALKQHFAEGALIEATCFKPLRHAEKKPLPSPPPAMTATSKGISLPKAVQKPAPKEVIKEVVTPKTHEPKIAKQIHAETQTTDETLAFIAKTLPNLKLTSLPEDWVDLYLIHESIELPLYNKLVESLAKKGFKALLMKAEELTSQQLTSSARLLLIRKELLLSQKPLHAHAKRDQNKQLFLGNLPVMLVPSDEELQTPQAKRSFWEQILIALS